MVSRDGGGDIFSHRWVDCGDAESRDMESWQSMNRSGALVPNDTRLMLNLGEGNGKMKVSAQVLRGSTSNAHVKIRKKFPPVHKEHSPCLIISILTNDQGHVSQILIFPGPDVRKYPQYTYSRVIYPQEIIPGSRQWNACPAGKANGSQLPLPSCANHKEAVVLLLPSTSTLSSPPASE